MATKAKLNLELPEAHNYKYLCPACTNEVTYADNPRNSGGSVYCPHCGLTKTYDPSRWVKIEA